MGSSNDRIGSPSASSSPKVYRKKPRTFSSLVCGCCSSHAPPELLVQLAGRPEGMVEDLYGMSFEDTVLKFIVMPSLLILSSLLPTNPIIWGLKKDGCSIIPTFPLMMGFELIQDIVAAGLRDPMNNEGAEDSRFRRFWMNSIASPCHFLCPWAQLLPLNQLWNLLLSKAMKNAAQLGAKTVLNNVTFALLSAWKETRLGFFPATMSTIWNVLING